MPKEIIYTDKAPAAVGTYSQAVKVITGNTSTIYISGQIGLNPVTMEMQEGFQSQAEQVMDNISAICEAAGAGLKNVTKFNVSLANLSDFDALNELFASRLTEPYPARAALQVAALPKGALVEIEAILFCEETE